MKIWAIGFLILDLGGCMGKRPSANDVMYGEAGVYGPKSWGDVLEPDMASPKL